MRLVLLTCDQPWQRTLAARLAAQGGLSLIVVDQHLSSAARAAALLAQPWTFARKLFDKRRVRSLEARDRQIYGSYFERIGAPAFSQVAPRVICAHDINAPEIAAAIAAAGPDLVLVSGTRLIRPPVLGCPSRFGTINLHTGLAPYYRGGPCTFWTLYNEEPEYAGATVHYLTAGIDSGDIILSARAECSRADGVASLDAKVIDLGQELVLRTLRLIEMEKAPRTPNWGKGRLFLYREFTAKVRLELEDKLRKGLMERCLRRLAADPPSIRTVTAP